MIYISAGLIHFYDVYGKTHRDNGPSYILRNYKSWLNHGKRHRLDGPALIRVKFKNWYINDKEYAESEYYDKLREMGLL